MRALLQRVARAEVRAQGTIVGNIDRGLLILLGVGRADSEGVADELASRVAALRIFGDDQGKTNRSLLDIGGAALVVSQFTLYADTRRGRRPSFTDAAPAEMAERLYGRFCAALERAGVPIARGRSACTWTSSSSTTGPMTIWLDSAVR